MSIELWNASGRKAGVGRIYYVYTGDFYTEGYFAFASKTKKRAIELITKDGDFKYDSREDLWSDYDQYIWYRVEEGDVLL